MTRHTISEPFPETIGVASLTIFAPEDFRGDAEIIWWYPGTSGDAHRQRMTCNANWLLQGIFRDVRGSRPIGDRLGASGVTLFDARVVALVIHAFYRHRIESAAKLEAAYQWRSCPPG
jgi:hypothetical protein